jgi:hypothetical protein
MFTAFDNPVTLKQHFCAKRYAVFVTVLRNSPIRWRQYTAIRDEAIAFCRGFISE